MCASSENTGDRSLLAALVWCVILLRIPGRSGSLVGELPFEPVLSEEFDRMLRPNRAVSAARSSAEQYLSHPQQIRSGCFGLIATFGLDTLVLVVLQKSSLTR